jgi:hypothetical protein
MRKNATTLAEQTNEASTFLKKTFAILMDRRNKDIIDWSPSGDTFGIVDQERFASEVLPYHFKHNNTKSFIRQLNIHGFKKAGSKKGKGRDYFNEYFKRGKPELLHLIQRISVKHKEDNLSSDQLELDSLRQENQGLKKKITELENSKHHHTTVAVELVKDNTDNKLLDMLKVITRIKSQRLKLLPLSPKEQAIYSKAEGLLDNIQELQEAHSLDSEDEDSWKEDSSLGKRSTLSLEQDLVSPNDQEMDNLPWFNREFHEEDSFASREFDFPFNN